MSEIKVCSRAEYQRHVLRSLLHYHERMMMNDSCPASHGCKNADVLEGKCPKTVFLDSYAEALKEAIRCIEIVHKDELLGH